MRVIPSISQSPSSVRSIRIIPLTSRRAKEEEEEGKRSCCTGIVVVAAVFLIRVDGILPREARARRVDPDHRVSAFHLLGRAVGGADRVGARPRQRRRTPANTDQAATKGRHTNLAARMIARLVGDCAPNGGAESSVREEDKSRLAGPTKEVLRINVVDCQTATSIF